MLLSEALRFQVHGWIDSHLRESELHFKYPGFGWIELPPGDGMHWLLAGISVFALLVAFGLLYRLAIAGLFLGFAYLFLLEQSNYLNQHYLLLVLALLLCFLPADRGLSLRSLRKGGCRFPTVPRWCIWTLRAQFEVILLWAGLVKLNPDWLGGQPLGLWLSAYESLPLLGETMASPLTALVASWAVILLHLVGAPLLLYRRTRLYAFGAYLVFHFLNSVLFEIGLFPWITIAGTLLFFEPDWPRQVWSRLGDQSDPAIPEMSRAPVFGSQPVLWVPIGIILVIQAVLPARGTLYPGRASWTGEGHWFAWTMKLDEKPCTSTFFVEEAGRSTAIDPAAYLTQRQLLVLGRHPDLILQFAHFLDQMNPGNTGVRARVRCSLNGRPPRDLVDPGIDLASEERSVRTYKWLLRLDTSR